MMDAEEKELLASMLTGLRVLSLAVLVDGAPYIGLLPFVVQPDFSALLIHASDMARHTQGLQSGAPFSALLHAPDIPGQDPLQIPRINFSGAVEKLDKNGAVYTAGRDLYLKKFPSGAQTFMLGDFNLYSLVMEKGRFVIRFGRALNISSDTLWELAQDG